jgi:ketosteroid isomerase-like protein
MDEASSNKDTLRRVMRAYTQGDLEPLMKAVAEDVVWDSNSPAPHFRFGGRYNGHVGLTEALSLIASEFHILRYDIEEMTGEGDIIWAMSEFEVLERRSGKHAQLRLANRWQFRAGKIVSCTEFFDSAGTLLQLDKIAPQAA